MKVHDTIPEIGTVIEWDIEEILSRMSGDVGFYKEDYAYAEFDNPEDVEQLSISELWELTLDHKRQDEHYEDVLESIREKGFLRPLTAHPAFEEGDYYGKGPMFLKFGDGHHRLAAAIDLGMKTVPVMVCEKFTCQPDSQEWRSGDPVPTVIEDRSKSSWK